MSTTNSKKKKKNQDIFFKVLISVLLLANVIATGVNAKSISKLAENNKPVTPVTTVVNDKLYEIKYGDTLSEIVKSQYGKYDYQLLMGLANYNNIKNVDKIYAGDTLLIPSAKTLADKPVTVAKQNNTVAKSETKSTVKTVSAKNNTVAKETVDTVKKEDIRTIKNDVDTLKKDVGVLQTEMTDVKSDIKSVNEKTAQNTEQINTLNSQVNEHTESVQLLETQTMINTGNIGYNTTEITKIKKHLDELESDFLSSKSDIDTILERLNEIEKNIDSVNNNTLSKKDFLDSIPSDTKVEKEEIENLEPQPFLEPNVYEEIKDKQEPDNTYFEYINTDDINTVSDENVEISTPVETEVITINPVETDASIEKEDDTVFDLPHARDYIPELDTTDLYGEQIIAKANMKTR